MAEVECFGDRLREARETRGIELAAIANATRITRYYLEALERGDLDVLPGGVFDRGYIRAYAEFLGIDPEPILEDYRLAAHGRGRGTAESVREMSRLLDRRDSPARRIALSRRGTIAIAVAALALAVGAAAHWISFEGEPAAAGIPAPRPAKVERRIRAERPAARTRMAPEAEPPSQVLERTMSVTESGVGTGVVARELVGRGGRFAEGTDVWFWTRVVGGGPGARIRHVWKHEGRTVASIELPIEGPHWRTYTRQTLPAGGAGDWAVEARSAEGVLLGREEFVCFAINHSAKRALRAMAASGGNPSPADKPAPRPGAPSLRRAFR